MNLVDAFVQEVKEAIAEDRDPITWDAFFMKYEVPAEDRGDFACAAILNQALPVLYEEGILTKQ